MNTRPDGTECFLEVATRAELVKLRTAIDRQNRLLWLTAGVSFLSVVVKIVMDSFKG